jgi:hypothetical protein
MSKEIQRELKITPPEVSVVEHTCNVYSCRHCESNHIETPILTAPMPDPVILGSLASPSALAYIMSQRFVVKRPPGRPAKDAQPPTVVEYSVEVQVVAPSETALRVEQELAGTFVLITTLPEDEWSNTEILEGYKGQTSVETRFRNLKADPCIVDTLYVNSSRRAEALAYLFLLALIVASYIEVRVRQELKKRQRSFLVPGNRWTERPTMSMIFDILSGVQILRLCNGTTTRRRLPSNIDPRVYELLELTGLDHKAYIYVSYAT